MELPRVVLNARVRERKGPGIGCAQHRAVALQRGIQSIGPSEFEEKGDRGVIATVGKRGPCRHAQRRGIGVVARAELGRLRLDGALLRGAGRARESRVLE